MGTMGALLDGFVTAFTWINLGEASPPRNEPRILVGTLTVLRIVPKVGLATSASG